jgi:hypothetical protein
LKIGQNNRPDGDLTVGGFFILLFAVTLKDRPLAEADKLASSLWERPTGSRWAASALAGPVA